jgi:hypothetical protein
MNNHLFKIPDEVFDRTSSIDNVKSMATPQVKNRVKLNDMPLLKNILNMYNSNEKININNKDLSYR